jgi:hypothetical protein
MKKTLLALPLLGALLLAGCGDPVEGTVVSKSHRDPWSETVMIPQYRQQCSSYYNPSSKTTSQRCTQVLSHYIPTTRHHEETWSLQVDDESTEKLRWTNVTQRTWNSTNVGEYYSAESEF